METSVVFGILRESLFFLIVFGVFLGTAVLKGRYSIINLILALYLALLISLKFPYFDLFLQAGNHTANAIVMIALFLTFVLVGIFLFRRHIPGNDFERPLEFFWGKVALALMATILVMAYSYHALPVTELITPGSPIQAFFAPEDHFFWWLILPLVCLFFVV